MKTLLDQLRDAATKTWQPIETAPKDGQHVLLACGQDPPDFVCEGYYEEDGDRGWFQANTHWTDAHDGSLWNVTHWMPLPPHPYAANLDLAAVQKVIATAVGLLDRLVDDEPCRHDHHGLCQTHSLGTDEHGNPDCQVEAARKFLAALAAREGKDTK